MGTLEADIASHPFLRSMRPEHVSIVVEGASQVQFDANQIIFRESDIAYQFYLLQEGRVAIESRVSNEGAIVIQTLGAGDVLGWSWLFPPYFLHFQARALERTRAVWLNAAHLLIACEENREFGYELMKRVSQLLIARLHATRRQLLECYQAQKSVEQKASEIAKECKD